MITSKPKTRKKRKSRKKVDIEGLKQKIYSLNEIQREIFEERAAIMEYDGGLSRYDAEFQALKFVGRI